MDFFIIRGALPPPPLSKNSADPLAIVSSSTPAISSGEGIGWGLNPLTPIEGSLAAKKRKSLVRAQVDLFLERFE